MGTLPAFILICCLISLQMHSKLGAKPIYLCVDYRSRFFLLHPLFLFQHIRFATGWLARKCCSSCVLLSSKPQPCFSQPCDLVGDFRSLYLFTLQKHYMTSRINRILSLLPQRLLALLVVDTWCFALILYLSISLPLCPTASLHSVFVSYSRFFLRFLYLLYVCIWILRMYFFFFFSYIVQFFLHNSTTNMCTAYTFIRWV